MYFRTTAILSSVHMFAAQCTVLSRAPERRSRIVSDEMLLWDCQRSIAMIW